MKNDILITLLSLLAIVTSCNKDDLNEIDAQKTIVTIDENGKANGNHRFTQISDTRFYVDDIEYTAQNGELVVSGYDKAYFNGDASIISVLKFEGRTLNVVGINNSAFRNCENLKSVKMSEGITIIGNEAFYGCIELKSINIPKCVITLGKYAFRGCANLSSVVIPNSVKNIGDDIFYGCRLTSLTIECDSISLSHISNSSLQSLVIGKNVKKITGFGDVWPNLTSIIVDEENECYDSRNKCNALIEKATNTLIIGCNKTFIPEGVNSIGNAAFYGRKDIKSIIIPESVTAIGNYAFCGCSGLVDIAIPKGLKAIGDGTFQECVSLSSMEIPEGITTIGNYAFLGCYGLTTIAIPNSVTSIADYAFSNCTNLSSIIIPDGVTKIGTHAFYGCSGVTSINIPYSLKEIGNDAFYGCNKVSRLEIDCETIDKFWGKYANSLLKYLRLGKHVKSFADFAISQCAELDTIVIDKENEKYDSRNDCNAIIETSVNKLVKGCRNSTIPETIECIADYAFLNCNNLYRIFIPNSVKSIGKNAFEGCDNLTSVHIKDLAAWCNIIFDSQPLRYAHHLYLDGKEIKNLIIPDGTTSISYSAFEGCSGLSTITIPNSVESIGENAFSGCQNINDINLGTGLKVIRYGAFANCKKLKNVFCSAVNPPSIGYNSSSYDYDNSYIIFYRTHAFDNASSLTAHVPSSCVDIYKNSVGWKEFGNIVSIEE